MVAFTILSALMVASVSIPNVAAQGQPTQPPNDNAFRGCGHLQAGGQFVGTPFCGE